MRDSLSNHGFINGCRSGKVISISVKTKKCAKYNFSGRFNVAVESHTCAINNKSSQLGCGSFPRSWSYNWIILQDKWRRILTKKISDNDSRMRSLLTHYSVQNKGTFHLDIPQLIFQPAHPIKLKFCSSLFLKWYLNK